jgi:hypothetical protein
MKQENHMSLTTNAPPPPHRPTADEIRAWLEFEYEPLRQRFAELTAALEAFLAYHPQINDDETQGKAADLRDQVRAAAKTGENARTAAKAPLLAGGKAVDAWFHNAGKGTEAPMARLVNVMNGHAYRKLEQERRAREEAARIAREEADRKATEAAETLLRSQPGSDAQRIAMMEAELAETSAAQAEANTTVRAADLTRARGDMGGVASLHTRWKWRERDHRLVPRDLMVIDSAKVNARIKLGGRGLDGAPLVKIPGIEIYSESTV